MNVIQLYYSNLQIHTSKYYTFGRPSKISTLGLQAISHTTWIEPFNFLKTQRPKNVQLTIYHPAEFFIKKTGVCVDLSRFGVETLKHISPESEPHYLMINFDPIQVSGNTLRLHWMVSYVRNGKRYFFADSKRPGYIAGPYNDTQEFIESYSEFRNRTIVSFKELESYQKKRRNLRLKQKAQPKKPNKRFTRCKLLQVQ